MAWDNFKENLLADLAEDLRRRSTASWCLSRLTRIEGVKAGVGQRPPRVPTSGHAQFVYA